jgi:tRNA(Ile)-lysidine synthase
MGRLYPKFRKYVTDNDLLQERDRAVVSVSGGIDSIVLLDLLVRLSKTMKFRLAVAHVNHALRGRESDGDEGLVREAADRYGLEFVSRKLTPGSGENLQDAARNLRQKFVMKLAAQRGDNAVCLGHNMCDQAETLMMHMIRGSGLAGLVGMRPLAIHGNIRMVRPLLFASREEIAQYADERSLRHREDSTNKKLRYRRNEIRHRLMPLLSDLNPRAVEALADMARTLGEDDDALSSIAEVSLKEAELIEGESAIVIDRKVYLELPIAIRKRLMRLAYARLAGSSADLNADQLERIDGIASSGRTEGEYRLKAPLGFAMAGDKLRLEKVAAPRGRSGSNARKHR